MLSKPLKGKIVREHQRHGTDTGSAEVQVGVLSRRIDELARHLKKNQKDHHSRRGLLQLVSKRRRLLGYLSRKKPEAHEKLIKKLGLKK
jgi:small subunit ribosomal protein S15